MRIFLDSGNNIGEIPKKLSSRNQKQFALTKDGDKWTFNTWPLAWRAAIVAKRRTREGSESSKSTRKKPILGMRVCERDDLLSACCAGLR